jgi:hypothetical protein
MKISVNYFFTRQHAESKAGNAQRFNCWCFKSSMMLLSSSLFEEYVMTTRIFGTGNVQINDNIPDIFKYLTLENVLKLRLVNKIWDQFIKTHINSIHRAPILLNKNKVEALGWEAMPHWIEKVKVFLNNEGFAILPIILPPKLTFLDLSNNQFLTDNHFSNLLTSGKLDNLTYLNLSGCTNLFDEAFVAFSSRVPPNLSHLNLNDCNGLTYQTFEYIRENYKRELLVNSIMDQTDDIFVDWIDQ